MSVRTIQFGESLERSWEELCFTKAALLARALTAHLAALTDPLIEEALALRQEQWRLWQGEMSAQASVVFVNFVLDNTAQDISEAKIDALRDENPAWRDKEAKDAKEYEAYFPSTLYTVIKLAPEAQVPLMRPWLKLLSTEKSTRLQALLPRLEQDIQSAAAALASRSDAQANTSLHRMRKIEDFIGRVNAFRTNLYADLLKLSQANRLPKAWASLFFRVAPQTVATEEARGMSRALLISLKARGLAPSDEQQKKIAKTTELDLLELWISRVFSASSVDAVLAG